MSFRAVVLCVIVVCCLLASSENVEGGQVVSGRVDGRIVRENAAGVAGATVRLNGTAMSATTDLSGAFGFNSIPAGTYSLTVTLGEHSVTIPNVVVSAGASTTVENVVAWDLSFSETLTVTATSRRPERMVEAPASVTKVSGADIIEQASHGQLPKLVEFAPGAQVTQGGLYDYNLNTRGFNSSLNRRVAVLVDGRNQAAAFFGAQEWAAASFPLDDLASVELVRGPSAALYGANASSGILNVVTKEPRVSRGGLVRVAFGQLGAANLDFRWAGALGNEWYGKALGGVRRGGDFFVSRRGAAEYSVPCTASLTVDCLPQESVVPSRIDDNEVFLGGARVDKYLDREVVLTMEGGITHVAGPVVQTGVGRTQITDVTRPWARFNVHANHANVFVAYTGRDAPGQLSLTAGTNSALLSHTVQFEGQTDRGFNDNRIKVVVGASAVLEHVDSFDEAQRRQTALFEPVTANQQAVFGQVDWNVAGPLRVVVAGRGDFSSLHSFQFSPKGSVVYAVAPGHSMRLTYNEAFQVPSYSEFFLQADAAPPVNLGGLNAFCAPYAVDCGFGQTRVLAVGNGNLELEKTRTLEIGYKGLIGGRALMTVDYYASRASNFITDLLRQLGTPLGRINPSFGPWEAPAGLPPDVADQVRAAAPAILSNNIDGSNILAAASYTNFGRVDTRGADLAFSYVLPAGWRGSATYSWFDFEIHNPVPGFDSMVLPNSPAHSASAAIGYVRGRFDANFAMRWVDAFRWSVGPFQGDVEAYTTGDTTVNYRFSQGLRVGINIANVFDDEHWELFGGDVLRRHALVSVGYEW